jgi:hypothetical protein
MYMDNFLMISRQLYDDWLAGDLSSEEFLVIHYLYSKANIITGAASVNYSSIASDLDDIFCKYKDPVNIITKLFSVLKDKKRIGYEYHSGSRGKFKAYVHEYPCLIQGTNGRKEVRLLDITSKFPSRDVSELSSSNQRSEGVVKPNIKGQNTPNDTDSSRGTHTIDKYINKERDNTFNKKTSNGRKKMLKALKKHNPSAFNNLYGNKSNK